MKQEFANFHFLNLSPSTSRRRPKSTYLHNISDLGCKVSESFTVAGTVMLVGSVEGLHDST